MTRRFRSSCTTRWSDGTSKAVVSRLTVDGHALLSERAYVRKSQPASVLGQTRAWGQTTETTHLLRVGAMCTDLAITAAGYVSGASAIRQRNFEPKG